MSGRNLGDRNPIDHEIGQAVRARRMAVGTTQAGLAKAIGVSFQQVQKYELGQNRIAVSRLIQIARALDCKVIDFIPEEHR